MNTQTQSQSPEELQQHNRTAKKAEVTLGPDNFYQEDSALEQSTENSESPNREISIAMGSSVSQKVEVVKKDLMQTLGKVTRTLNIPGEIRGEMFKKFKQKMNYLSRPEVVDILLKEDKEQAKEELVEYVTAKKNQLSKKTGPLELPEALEFADEITKVDFSEYAVENFGPIEVRALKDLSQKTRVWFGVVPIGSNRFAPEWATDAENEDLQSREYKGFEHVAFVDVNATRLDHHRVDRVGVCATDLVLESENEDYIKNVNKHGNAVLDSRGRKQRRLLVAHKSPDTDSIVSSYLFYKIAAGELTEDQEYIEQLRQYVHDCDLANPETYDHGKISLDDVLKYIKDDSKIQNAVDVIVLQQLKYQLAKRKDQLEKLREKDPENELAQQTPFEKYVYTLRTKQNLEALKDKAIYEISFELLEFMERHKIPASDIGSHKELFKNVKWFTHINAQVQRGNGNPAEYPEFPTVEMEKVLEDIAQNKERETQELNKYLETTPIEEVYSSRVHKKMRNAMNIPKVNTRLIYQQGVDMLTRGVATYFHPEFPEKVGPEVIEDLFQKIELLEEQKRRELFRQFHEEHKDLPEEEYQHDLLGFIQNEAGLHVDSLLTEIANIYGKPGMKSSELFSSEHIKAVFLRQGPIREDYEKFEGQAGGNSNPWNILPAHNYIVPPRGGTVLNSTVVQSTVSNFFKWQSIPKYYFNPKTGEKVYR